MFKNFWVKIKGAFKSKTMVLSFLITIFGVLSDNLTYLQGMIKPEWYGLFAMGIGITMGILRWVTNKPIEDK